MKKEETKEEVLVRHCKNTRGQWIGLIMNNILEAMEEYANNKCTDKTPSVEDIDKEFPISSNHQMDTDSWNNRLRQEGAKWVINKMLNK